MAAAGLLVAGCAVIGWWLTQRGVRLHLGNTFPVRGDYRLPASLWMLVPLPVAAAVWYASPRLSARLGWRALLVAGYLTALGWAVALALVDGPAGLTEPLTGPGEYLSEVDRIGAMGVADYLRGFTDRIIEGRVPGAGPGWANHVAGHPPLLTLLFVLLARAGLAGPGWAAALCVAVGAAAVPAVLSTVRLLAGEGWARRAAPFVAAAPVALWVASSADAIIAGVAAAGIAVLAQATARYPVVLSALGGLLLGVAMMLSYGMALLAPVALAVTVVLAGWRGAAWRLAIAAAVALAVLASFAVAGFWWLEGLGLAADRVRLGQGWSDRPAWYFLLANPAALAVAVGPAVVAAVPLVRRHPRLAAPAAGAAAAVGLALVANLSKGEVERIWLAFAVWLLPLAALLRSGESDLAARGWLAAHLGWPIVVSWFALLSW